MPSHHGLGECHSQTMLCCVTSYNNLFSKIILLSMAITSWVYLCVLHTWYRYVTEHIAHSFHWIQQQIHYATRDPLLYKRAKRCTFDSAESFISSVWASSIRRNADLTQSFGYGRYTSQSGLWIRIRINWVAGSDPDPGGQKWPTKIEKSKEFSCFEVMDYLFW